jgi:hypothetical protein
MNLDEYFARPDTLGEDSPVGVLIVKILAKNRSISFADVRIEANRVIQIAAGKKNFAMPRVFSPQEKQERMKNILRRKPVKPLSHPKPQKTKMRMTVQAAGASNDPANGESRTVLDKEATAMRTGMLLQTDESFRAMQATGDKFTSHELEDAVAGPVRFVPVDHGSLKGMLAINAAVVMNVHIDGVDYPFILPVNRRATALCGLVPDNLIRGDCVLLLSGAMGVCFEDAVLEVMDL